MADIYLIDSNNLAYRAHNAKYDLTTKSGMPSGMFYNYIRTLMSLKKKNRSFVFHVVWDGRPKKKYEIQPDYKAGRTKLGSKIWAQTDDIKMFLENCGVIQYLEPEYEADDVIATLAKIHKEKGDTVIIYSNDKDMLQLVEDGKVVVHKPKVGLSEEKFYDEDAVKEKFGVHPELVPCYRSFDGDSSDNISGVPRVPRKIIAGMANKYGTINKIYENIHNEKLTEKQRSSFNSAQERVMNNFKLIKLDQRLEIKGKTDPKYDESVLEGLIQKYEITTINPQDVIDLFSSTINKKYTDAQKVDYVLENFSLF